MRIGKREKLDSCRDGIGAVIIGKINRGRIGQGRANGILSSFVKIRDGAAGEGCLTG